MASPAISPLRYQKGSHGSSPAKGSGAVNRPLSELSPMAIRRNSPSFPQIKGSSFKKESSPATSSPFSSNGVNSPHVFWQQRDVVSPSRENQNPHEVVSPSKRSSIENLKKASRVKNSSMFAKEQQNNYDPARPSILDGRPSGIAPHGNSLSEYTSTTMRHSFHATSMHQSIATTAVPAPLSPSKLNASPAKSSLSKKTGANMRYSGFDPESGIWEDDDDQERKLPEGRTLHRHAKSVTFDQAPPQINEYEMTTPDPSSVASGSREGSYDSYEDEDEEYSFERGSSMDHDDSFDASLEDTEKTPVVLPEDWRFMNPAKANTDLAQHEEDVFDDDVGSPAPGAEPGKTNDRPHQTSVNSIDSNGQARPLPPLPPALGAGKAQNSTRNSLSGAIERMSSGQRCLPSPPPAASMSKSDLRRMSRESLSLEDRLRLMMINENQKSPQRLASKESSPRRCESNHQFNEDSILSTGTIPSYNSPSRLDRSAILKQLQDSRLEESMDDSEEAFHGSSALYDPDVPVPSLEDPTQYHEEGLQIKEEEVDDDDLYAIPDMYSRLSDEFVDEDNIQACDLPAVTTTEVAQVEGNETPRAATPLQDCGKKSFQRERMSLPDFEDFGDNSSFNLGFSEYLTPPDEKDLEKALPELPNDHMERQSLQDPLQRSFTPEEQLLPPKLSFSDEGSSAEPGTPSSVIRHPVSLSPEVDYQIEAHETEQSRNIEDTVPAEEAPQHMTSHQDMEYDSVENKPQIDMDPEAITEKRVSSLVQLQIAHEGSNGDLDLLGLEKEFDRVVEQQKVAFELSLHKLYYPFHGRFPSGELPSACQDSLSYPMKQFTDFPRSDGARATNDKDVPAPLSLPLGPRNFANRAVPRQRGYLMRQNTKLVVASERAVQEERPQSSNSTTSATAESTTESTVEPNEVRPSSRKASQPTWTAEPWNGKSRRRSIRVGGEKATARRKPVEGPAPPLPGQSSNVQENLGAVVEDEFAEEEAEDFEEGVERGRLFVKVVGAKDLQLPLPQHERTYFALTLDNGIHCVTTAWLDLGRDAPIGQEFELVVLNDLEFQLTLQMKLEQPKAERPASPTKPAAVSPKKQGAFGRLFGSPKKKKESDHRVSQEVRRPMTPPSAYELVQGVVAKDGSFARAYVTLSEHEKQAYGRPYQVDIKCFNEWAMEEVSAGSSRSKKGIHLQSRPPYEIGKLELQLLYIPKPKGAKDEEMPKSMNSAMRSLRDAEEKMRQQANIKNFEGYLSQQGGDCPYWRRRFFKLVGSKLTAYHETTLQPRATINLNKANKLIDDKSSLTKKETSTRGGGRRKSAFADDEEGYMFVEEGFRIRFANGEVIDFYADSTALKEEWMEALGQVVGKNVSNSSSSAKGWAEMVLKREKSMKAKAQVEASMKKINKEVSKHDQVTAHIPQQAAIAHASSIPVPTAVVAKTALPTPRLSAHARTESYQGTSGTRSQASSPVKSRVTPAERRAKARSIAF